MMIAAELTDWHDFYAAAANVSAALVGLVFVAISLHLGRRPLDQRDRVVGTMTLTALLHPLFAALAMLLPLSARVRGAGLAVLALVGLAAAIAIANYERRKPRDETQATLFFRFVLPLVACVVLLVASLVMVADVDEATFGPAIFIFLMLIVGTQNAWDMLIGSRDVAAGAAITREPADRR